MCHNVFVADMSECRMEFRPSSGPEAAPGRKEPSKYVHGGNNDPPGKHKDRKLFRGEVRQVFTSIHNVS